MRTRKFLLFSFRENYNLFQIKNHPEKKIKEYTLHQKLAQYFSCHHQFIIISLMHFCRFDFVYMQSTYTTKTLKIYYKPAYSPSPLLCICTFQHDACCACISCITATTNTDLLYIKYFVYVGPRYVCENLLYNESHLIGVNHAVF